MEIKKLVAAIANRLGFLDAYSLLRRKLTKSQVAILMYHRVSPQKDNWSLQALSPQSFERQIQYLSKNYEILPIHALTQCLQQGKPLPEKAVTITLDDGYRDNYVHAYPILKKYDVPATIFLTTGHINTGELFWFDKVRYIIHNTSLSALESTELGRYTLQSTEDRIRSASAICQVLKKLPDKKKNLLIEKLYSEYCESIPNNLGRELILSWEEIREMKNNITFGAHTVTHPILTRLSLEQAKYEIMQSKKDIEENIGQKVTSFCYPNGSLGDFNREIVKLIKESGFTSAVTAIPGLITPEANPYELRRLPASTDFNIFKVLLSGSYPDLIALLNRMKIKS